MAKKRRQGVRKRKATEQRKITAAIDFAIEQGALSNPPTE